MESSVQVERQFSRASISVVPHLLEALMTSPAVLNVGCNVVADDVGFDVTGGDGATSALKQGPF